jgi:protein-S-isoprenylcysteine O-methyltransferase Ste14
LEKDAEYFGNTAKSTGYTGLSTDGIKFNNLLNNQWCEMAERIILIAGFLFLIVISKKTIRSIHSHGLYRLVAWMGIWALFMLNWRSWFRNPFSINQLISWVFLVISITLIVMSLSTLKQSGKPDQTRSNDTLLGLEKTTQLVTSGIYRYIRHPMYSSLLFLGFGIFFKAPAFWGFIILLLVIISLALTAKAEEAEDIRYFGDAYKAYMDRTKKFIPYIW